MIYRNRARKAGDRMAAPPPGVVEARTRFYAELSRRALAYCVKSRRDVPEEFRAGTAPLELISAEEGDNLVAQMLLERHAEATGEGLLPRSRPVRRKKRVWNS